MSIIIKSFSVGNGDMFYIKHGSDNFSVIDCCLRDDGNDENIIDEIIEESKDKGIKRFISTHPDDDHIGGLKKLDSKWTINNFYCVENKATKDDESEDFKKYCELRDSEKKSFYIYKGCRRKWMNMESDESDSEKRGSAGLTVLWPDTSNQEFKNELGKVKSGNSPNNISPIIKYSLNDGVTCLWLGDIEGDFLEKVKEDISFCEIDILFAPHHGRDSGKIPEEILKQLNPKVVIIGEAKSKDLNYYNNYNTITQNSAKDIIFECIDDKVHIYVGSSSYSVDFLEDEGKNTYDNYIGSFQVNK
ncbi:hypothetical protein A500_19234 [Clostridium sartagoforme AAU1]|uniref:Metallo-beta-lactamase domain-containing protein n=1 Tax=Clostridium sartagoforme AAU1 TaxID=1202534 RepID=R9BSJ4_9CLOT|nr:MBL fold metallo-hydrolase [Clostridium sartagoforme]EOR19977.1 hypothetical protein A500_19234 [Clostridium sartagoforme AAU1]